jgi:hypothetical protein
VPPQNFVTIPNGYDDAEWPVADSLAVDSSAQTGRQFVISYTGSLYLGRNPLPIFRALHHLAESGEIDLSRVRIDLIGDCETSEGRPVVDIARECGVHQAVNVHRTMPKMDVLRRMLASDLLLLLAEELTLQIPAKAYEYLRAARPILALASHDGAVTDLLRRTHGAWIVHPADDVGIAAALRDAYKSWLAGRYARVPDGSVVAQFDRQHTVRDLAELLDDLVL